MVSPGAMLESTSALPRLLAGRLLRWWRKGAKLLRQPVRFFDDARQERVRDIGFQVLFVLYRHPLTPRSVYRHLVRSRWRLARGRGAGLLALRGLRPLSGSDFETLDEDPQLEICRKDVPLPRGPLRIWIQLERTAGREPPRLLVDLGRGFQQEFAQVVTLDGEGRGALLCILPMEGEARLRLDPGGSAGRITVQRLLLRPISFKTAFRELCQAGWQPSDARRYLLTGQPTRPRTARRSLPGSGQLAPVVRPEASAWEALARRPRVSQPDRAVVDVVIPVYGDADATLACLYSVLASPQRTPVEVTVIDDCGPDPALRAELSRLAALEFFTLLPNEQNLGFVRSANRGLRLHRDRDVVLLNADTEVYHDWLDRLRAIAEADSVAATVTPLTNDGEIAGYPFFVQRFPYSLELPFDAVDRLAAACNAGVAVPVPTGVGFCLYMRRAAIEEVGLFDAEAFGSGYGEENDFCLRARQRGWRHLITPSVFVRHVGGRSFGVSKVRRVQAAMGILARRYPTYRESIDSFIARDPLAPYRRRLDQERLRRLPRQRSVLAIVHTRGGGTEAFVQDQAQRRAAEGVLTLVARPARRQLSVSLKLEVAGAPYLPNLPELRLVGDWQELAAFLQEQGVERIEVHNLVGFHDQVLDEIPRLARHLGVDYDIYLHDYQALCPRINLVKPNLSFCDVGAPSECQSCLKSARTPFPVRDIVAWRQRYAALLKGAGTVLSPSQDTAERFRRFFSDLPMTVAPHPDLLAWDLEQPPGRLFVPPRRPGVRRICLIGGLSEIKGLRMLSSVAELALRRNVRLEFVVVGESSDPALLRRFPHVHATGRYDEASILGILRLVQPDLAWFPAIWPETFSYTLSIAYRLRLPVLVPELGALTRLPEGAGEGDVKRRIYAPSARAEHLLEIMENWP